MVGRRVIIVGAGPAGIRVARETLVAAGLRPTLIDESRRDGGQIYRRQPERFTRSYAALYGTEAKKRRRAVHSAFDALRERIDYLPETLVWNIAERRVYAAERLAAEIAAVRCARAVHGRRRSPDAGEGLESRRRVQSRRRPGCAQIAGVRDRSTSSVHGHRRVCSISSLLSTSKPALTWPAVLDTSPRSRRVTALRQVAGPALRCLCKGVALEFTLRRRRHTYIYGASSRWRSRAHAETGVRGLSFRDSRGRVRRIECDAVGLGYHLRPETQLADLARCEFHFDAHTRQWLPQVDTDGRSSVPRRVPCGRWRASARRKCGGSERQTAGAGRASRISASRTH